MSLKIFVKPSGSVVSLYNEKLDIRKLGNSVMRRVASIEPGEGQEASQWVVTLEENKTRIGCFSLRSEALEFEETTVVRRLRNGK